jgi:hypothetical protein
MNIDNDDLIDISHETILDHIYNSKCLEIHGVTEDGLGICKQTANSEPFDFISLYLRLKEGGVICVGDFGINSLNKLYELCNWL